MSKKKKKSRLEKVINGLVNAGFAVKAAVENVLAWPIYVVALGLSLILRAALVIPGHMIEAASWLSHSVRMNELKRLCRTLESLKNEMKKTPKLK